MADPTWKPWDDACELCGGDIEVATLAKSDAYDGDIVRCKECGAEGVICGDDDSDLAGIDWFEELNGKEPTSDPAEEV